MHRHKRNFWPALYIAAGLAGLASVSAIIMVGMLLFELIMRTGTARAGSDSNPFLLVIVLIAFIAVPGAASLGIFMKKWWGRGVMTFFAIILLFGFPLGTALGIFVLMGLSEHRDEFRKSR